MSTRADSPYHVAMKRYGACLIRAALRRNHGNRTHAARALGLQRTYMLRLMRNERERETTG